MELVKNSQEIQLNLAKLEATLVAHFRPVFLFISNPDENKKVEIIVSCVKFNYLTIQERTIETFNLINGKCPDIIKNMFLVIQCYDTKQMEDLLMDTFE